MKIHESTTEYADGVEVTNEERELKTVTVELSSSLPSVDARAELGAIWEHTDGITYKTARKYTDSTLVRKPHSVNQSATMSGVKKASQKGSVTSFEFEGSFNDQTAKYLDGDLIIIPLR